MAYHKHLHPLNKRTKVSDYILYFFSITTPLFMLPQAIVIYQSHSAVNVALLTWGYFLLADIVWLTYGIKNRLMPIIVCHVLYLIIETAIVIGIIMYQ